MRIGQRAILILERVLQDKFAEAKQELEAVEDPVEREALYAGLIDMLLHMVGEFDRARECASWCHDPAERALVLIEVGTHANTADDIVCAARQIALIAESRRRLFVCHQIADTLHLWTQEVKLQILREIRDLAGRQIIQQKMWAKPTVH